MSGQAAESAGNDVPTKGQRYLLELVASHGGESGMLGADLRSYDACLRRGWLVEKVVERDFGLGPGQVAAITDAGRAALARAVPPEAREGDRG